MADRAVHWHEGQFLQPHHFQAADRAAALERRRGLWGHPFGYGICEFRLDPDALLNSRLVLRSLRAVFRDGTPVAVPDDAPLPAVDLKPLFRPGEALLVLIALPSLHLGQANVAEEGADSRLARFRVATHDLEDENTGVNPQPVQVRSPNLRWLFPGDDPTGYDTLPLLRLRRSADANAPPELDPTFAPPLLNLDAWPMLGEGVVRAVAERVGRKRERIAGLLAARGAGVGSPDPADVLAVAHLRELGAAQATLAAVAFTPALPAFEAYRELARLAGSLTQFDPQSAFPAIPPYDHDDPATCFGRLKLILDALLEILPDPAYKARPFVGVGARLEAPLDATWLSNAWGLVIGLRTDGDPDEGVRLLTQPGQLDMKLGAGDRADSIFKLGQAGLRFEPCPRPGVLPDQAATRYFRVGRDPEREYQHVQRALTLAVRVNETRLVGPVAGSKTITVRTPAGGTATFALTLYAIPAEGP